MRKVAIVMGSKSDLPVAEKAVGVLRDYGVQMEVRVLSAVSYTHLTLPTTPYE